MHDSIENALWLMVIGMIMVFLVLSLVVYGVKWLILLSNNWTADVPQSRIAHDTSEHNNTIKPEVVAAISAAVLQWSNGTHKVDKINKV